MAVAGRGQHRRRSRPLSWEVTPLFIGAAERGTITEAPAFLTGVQANVDCHEFAL